jgi:hypothetical protein
MTNFQNRRHEPAAPFPVAAVALRDRRAIMAGNLYHFVALGKPGGLRSELNAGGPWQSAKRKVNEWRLQPMDFYPVSPFSFLYRRNPLRAFFFFYGQLLSALSLTLVRRPQAPPA